MTRVVTIGTVACALALVPLLWSASTAQEPAPGVAVEAPPPPPPAPRLGLEPSIPPEEGRIREQEFYPFLVPAPHEPAFVTPFVATVPVSRSSAIRVGFSGWTTPAAPYDIPEASGGVAFGFSLVWVVPVGEQEPPDLEVSEER